MLTQFYDDLETRTENEPWVGTGICMGTDANRNWGYHLNDGGASNDPWDEAFMGSGEFSGVEGRNVRDFLLAHNDSIKFYNSLHSFGQMVIFMIIIWIFAIVLAPRCYCHGGSVRHGQTPMMISTAWPCWEQRLYSLSME